jgi:hypothetical protein
MTNFSVYARKRGIGWEANWFVSRAVQEYLFRLIMGTRHSQSAFVADKDSNGLFQGGLGPGATEISGQIWSDFNGHYPAIPCAAGVELGDGVGFTTYDIKNEAEEVLHTAKVPVFFGLKHMWGNLWAGVRGLIMDAGAEKSRTYVARSLYENYDNESVEGMILASEQPRTEGYIKKQSMSKLCCMPVEVGATNATFFADYFWTNAASSQGLRCRFAGGLLYHDTNAGAAATRSNDAVAVATANTSSPLCYFEADPVVE